jgi:prevent-host-death family protein
MAEAIETIEVDDPVLVRLAAAVAGGGSLVLTRHGEPVAAVVAVAELERLRDELELLRRLALGELESAAGEGETLDAVLEECRLLLEDN